MIRVLDIKTSPLERKEAGLKWIEFARNYLKDKLFARQGRFLVSYKICARGMHDKQKSDQITKGNLSKTLDLVLGTELPMIMS